MATPQMVLDTLSKASDYGANSGVRSAMAILERTGKQVDLAASMPALKLKKDLSEQVQNAIRPTWLHDVEKTQEMLKGTFESLPPKALTMPELAPLAPAVDIAPVRSTDYYKSVDFEGIFDEQLAVEADRSAREQEQIDLLRRIAEQGAQRSGREMVSIAIGVFGAVLALVSYLS